MKKIYIAWMALLCAGAGLFAQERVVERTWLSTDRDVYVAGEPVWYSAFCIDASRGTFSPVSSVAYVELHSAAGMAATSKVALENGRGAGRLQLPGTLPTGNYRLVVYTVQNRDEVDYDFSGIASKTISVFNVFANDRVEAGVEVVEPAVYEGLRERRSLAGNSALTNAGGASLDVSWQNGELTVVNRGDQPATFSLSVAHDDGFLSNGNPGIGDFLSESGRLGPRAFRNELAPEFEGEVIHGKVTGFSEAMIPNLIGKFAFISTPTDKSDVYAAPIREDGSVVFYTGNIYGDKDCVCEIEGIDPSLNCHIELASPFVNAQVPAPAPLVISPVLEEALKARSVGMQVERRFTADTMYEFLPVRENGLFDDDVVIRYVLDDYTRFPTMAEDFIEFMPEIRARHDADGHRDIRVLLQEDYSGQTFSSEKTLMLLDGVPVFDQEKIMQYDPLLVESVNIYPHTHFIGSRVFAGVVNFITYKRNLPSFTFDNNARIVNWQGESYPMAYTCEMVEAGGGYPDYRQTIYWHPLLELGAGESMTIRCKLPDYKGSFDVWAEGMTRDGKPACGTVSFTIQ
jgi:hypothetical protein